MNVKEVMSATAVLITPQTPAMEAARVMRDGNIGFLPVGENDRLVGTLTDRDITVRGVAEGTDTRSLAVADVMSPELVYCLEDQDVGEAAALMAEHRVRRLPVLGRDKRLVGIVSLGDIATGTEHLGLSGATVEAVSRDAS